ncbi:MAG TPA: alpha/beta fold hydrolase [Devosia sp.]|nr:alpha/beta fold hydrolase [Devosia sp.]
MTATLLSRLQSTISRQALRQSSSLLGGGGDPSRHAALLRRLANEPFRVVAPYFPSLASSTPSSAELQRRLRRLELATKHFAPPGIPINGVGHSIGAATLLMLGGTQGQTMGGEVLSAGHLRFRRLVLLAPAIDFFRAPGALSSLATPLTIWAGGQDRITTLASFAMLKDAVPSHTKFEFFVDDWAGHFTFMNEPPPGILEPHPNRETFLLQLSEAICSTLSR